ncbi:hypothetical protein CSUI_008570 [Cystoisospora suis]|uniref:Transmembrane protein n=1 Tax=Cystoisospora suis TaxID=483139 RepID=A0A2C6KMB7_9APIC|nr:hypothetical protein CSUI_008570 [Cystoisospora suis]
MFLYYARLCFHPSEEIVFSSIDPLGATSLWLFQSFLLYAFFILFLLSLLGCILLRLLFLSFSSLSFFFLRKPSSGTFMRREGSPFCSLLFIHSFLVSLFSIFHSSSFSCFSIIPPFFSSLQQEVMSCVNTREDWRD